MLETGGPKWRTCALIVAGGKGLRMGGDVPKQYLPIRGVPLLAWTIAAYHRSDLIDEIVLVVPEADLGFVAEAVVDMYRFDRVRRIVAGGIARQDSVAAGLQCVEGDDDVVLVHDGVRPFVSEDTIRRAAECAREKGAALVAVPVTDTIKRVDDRRQVVETVPRESLWAAQTPQAFHVAILRQAMERAQQDGFEGTDEASLVERLGVKVPISHGDGENIKVTTPADLARAETIAAGRELPC